MNDFSTRVKILVVDFQIYFLLYFFLLYVPGRAFIAYDFFKDNGEIINCISFFTYFIYFDFVRKKTIAMKLFNYEIIVPDNIEIISMIKYEILSFVDFLMFPIYFMTSTFTDKKGKKPLRETYSNIQIKKIQS